MHIDIVCYCNPIIILCFVVCQHGNGKPPMCGCLRYWYRDNGITWLVCRTHTFCTLGSITNYRFISVYRKAGGSVHSFRFYIRLVALVSDLTLQPFEATSHPQELKTHSPCAASESKSHKFMLQSALQHARQVLKCCNHPSFRMKKNDTTKPCFTSAYCCHAIWLYDHLQSKFHGMESSNAASPCEQSPAKSLK